MFGERTETQDRRDTSAPAAEDAARDTARDLRLPDFIIGGAPKCGTSTLHFLLDARPDVGIPYGEQFYFDSDDPLTHPDFFHTEGGRLVFSDPRPDHRANLEWYASRFAGVRDKSLIGDDSTSYLFSEVAPQRIKALIPQAKLIFVLRDPVARAHSQYWHDVTQGRLVERFEDALYRHPWILKASSYAPSLRNYVDVFGRGQIHVVLFEDLVADPQAEADRVADFLGVPRRPIEPEASWVNRTTYPVSAAGQRALNRVGRVFVRARYRARMSATPSFRDRLAVRLSSAYSRRVGRLLLSERARPSAMREDTRRFLTGHLRERNAGLEDLLGRSLADVWPTFSRGNDTPR